MIKTVFLLFALILPAGSAFAGEFAVSSGLDPVQATGFYRIQLDPGLISYAKHDYSDIRILDSRSREIPYLFREETPGTPGCYSRVTVAVLSQRDSSNKKSYVTLHFDHPYELGRFEFQVSGPGFYQRNVYIGIYEDQYTIETPVKFVLSSARPAVWEPEKLRAQDLVLIIDNQDNPPLKIKNVTVYQLKKYLVARLEKDETYSVCAGNEKLFMPHYDLRYFSDSIPDTLATLRTHRISAIPTGAPSGSGIIFTRTVLWGVILLVIGLMGFLSVRMIQEMNRK
jgi:hypothetical protein